MTTRTGAPTLVKIARELCRLITKFSPVLAIAYPGNVALQAALAAANAACMTLSEELSAVIPQGD